jgi:hypothetical protein
MLTAAMIVFGTLQGGVGVEGYEELTSSNWAGASVRVCLRRRIFSVTQATARWSV